MDERIAWAEKALGITLLPWQRQYAESILRGDRVVLLRGRKAGWTTVGLVLNTIENKWEEN